MTSRRAARNGFTLVELLVVIAIIGLLMGLLLPALGRVRVTAKEADNSAHIRAIEQGVNNYTQKMKVDYIPSHGGGVATATSSNTFRFRGAYPGPGPVTQDNPDQSSFEAVYLKQVFPQLNLAATNLPYENADPSQVLAFFLTGVGNQGFSNNKQQPFTPPATTGESRVGPFIEVKTENFDSTPNYPRLLDKWTVPIAYFSAFSPTGRLDYGNGTITQTYGAAGGVAPYNTGGAPLKFLNPKTFQIISAGKDKTFGAGGTWQPGVGNYNPSNGVGYDDFSNFATLRLGAQ